MNWGVKDGILVGSHTILSKYKKRGVITINKRIKPIVHRVITGSRGGIIATNIIVLFFTFTLLLGHENFSGYLSTLTGGTLGNTSKMDIVVDVDIQEDGRYNVTETTEEIIKEQNGHFYSMDTEGISVEDMTISVGLDGSEVKPFTQAQQAGYGEEGVFTVRNNYEEELKEYRIYQPIKKPTRVKTVYTYTVVGDIEKYGDVAVLDRVFVTGLPKRSDVTINIHTPRVSKDDEQFNMWIHGFSAYKSEPVITTHEDKTQTVTYTIPDNPIDEFVEVRLTVPGEALPGLRQTVVETGLKGIQKEERKLARRAKFGEYMEIVTYGVLALASMFFTVKGITGVNKRKEEWQRIAGSVPDTIYVRPNTVKAVEVKRMYTHHLPVDFEDIISMLLDFADRGLIRIEEDGYQVRIIKTVKARAISQPLTDYENVLFTQILLRDNMTFEEIEKIIHIGVKEKGNSRVLGDISRKIAFEVAPIGRKYKLTGGYGLLQIASFLLTTYIVLGGGEQALGIITQGVILISYNLLLVYMVKNSGYVVYEDEGATREAQMWASYLNMMENIGQLNRRTLTEQVVWGELFTDAAAFGLLETVEKQIDFELPNEVPVQTRTMSTLTATSMRASRSYSKATSRSSSGSGSGRRSGSGGSGGGSSRGSF